MYQLIVFPYTDDQELFIRAIGSKNNCRVRKVVTLKGWKQKESCSFFREDGSLTFQPIETDLFPIQESDTLLIPPFFASPRTEQLVVAKIMDLVPVLNISSARPNSIKRAWRTSNQNVRVRETGVHL